MKFSDSFNKLPFYTMSIIRGFVIFYRVTEDFRLYRYVEKEHGLGPDLSIIFLSHTTDDVGIEKAFSELLIQGSQPSLTLFW